MSDPLPRLPVSPGLHQIFVHLRIARVPAALVFWIVASARRRDDLSAIGTCVLDAGAALATVVAAQLARRSAGRFARGVVALAIGTSVFTLGADRAAHAQHAPHGQGAEGPATHDEHASAPAADESAHDGHDVATATDQRPAHEAGGGAVGQPVPAGHDVAVSLRPLDLPGSRDASGTAWQPDATPMHAIHRMRGPWALMLHASAFAGWDEQGTDRGDGDLTSVNWIMLMASRPAGGGEFGLRGMFSAEPWTVGDDGYPLLLQSGETAGGEPLHDRQHPHDLFMELAARYAHPVSRGLAFEIYAALAGEPALGPVAFPHRASAASDPLAPLSHHWQDSTHISFGVLTAGLFSRTWKLEGSWFNGREPDEEREDLDLASPDSWAARFTVNPGERWSVQVSTGWLESPEALEPDLSIRRSTASVSHVGQGSGGRPWSLTAAWGRNDPDEGPSTDALLVEADVPVGRRDAVFGRIELVGKTGHDLALGPALEHDVFDVLSVVAGYAHDFPARRGWVPGIGVRVSANFMEDGLSPFYGDDVGYGGMVFFRIRPDRAGHAAANRAGHASAHR